MNSWKQDCSDLTIDQDLDAIFNPDSYFQVDEACPNFLDVSQDSSNPSPFGDRLSLDSNTTANTSSNQAIIFPKQSSENTDMSNDPIGAQYCLNLCQKVVSGSIKAEQLSKQAKLKAQGRVRSKRSRDLKKQCFGDLQNEVASLRMENDHLRAENAALREIHRQHQSTSTE